jgi:hypothetical protein
MILVSLNANAQVVKQPVSDVTTSIKHYSYTYNVSATQHKEIEYILVKASNGDIKSTFNACDVCYPYHKGYSQSGTKLRCNNCGNSFEIDSLGNQGSGGCWPGHLVHSLDGDSVVINVSDLIAGEYFFPLVNTSVDDNINAQISILNYNDLELRLSFPDSYPFNIKIYTVYGGLVKSLMPNSNEFSIDISDLSSGGYFILAEFKDTKILRNFCIVR